MKVSIGKLELKNSYDRLKNLLQKNSIDILPIRFEHTITLITLPFYHKDPFDRLIISQAKTEKLTIVSKDDNFRFYNINKIW